MADYLIQESTLTGIADAIRTKEGSAGPIATTDFASRIANMFTGEDLDPELGAQDALIAQISEVLDGKGFAPDPDTLVVPDAYTGLLEQAKALYDGEYADRKSVV